MNRLKLAIFAVVATLGLVASPVASAIDLNGNICNDLQKNSSANCGVANENKLGRNNNIVQRVLGLVFYLLGAIAIIMIIIGGIRYATSQGDSQKVQTAKNTIFYAVIGLIVAILASVIVTFVGDQLKKV